MTFVADMLDIPDLPENHCGTAYCYAGKVVIDAGGKIARSEEGRRSGHYVVATQEEIDANLTSKSWLAKQYPTPVVMVEDRAARLLGITEHEASELFSCNNTIEDLRRIVGEIIARAESMSTTIEPRG